jgi:hypothetical protein
VSWLSFAAGLLRDAMSSDDSSTPVREEPRMPPDLAGIADYVNKLRADTEKNFEAVAAMLRAQNEQLLRTIQIQRRWNYGLAGALVVVAILAAAAYVRG